MRGEMRLFAAQIFGDEISSSPTGNRLKTTRKQRVGLALRSCWSWLAKTPRPDAWRNAPIRRTDFWMWLCIETHKNQLKTTRKQRVGPVLRSCSSWLAKTHSLMRGEMRPFAEHIVANEFSS